MSNKVFTDENQQTDKDIIHGIGGHQIKSKTQFYQLSPAACSTRT